MICIEPFGGLANRMRALDSALILAKKKNKKVKVIWKKNSDLNCEVEKLFELPENVEIETIEFDREDQNHLVGKIYSRLQNNSIIRNYLTLRSEKYFSRKKIAMLKKKDYDFSRILKHKKVYIRSQDRFYMENELFADFSIKPEITETVDRISAKFSDYTIGIHIRRTDNTQSIKYSPLSKFVWLIESDLSTNPETRFLLATDCPEEEQLLIAKFGDKIITYEGKTLGRDKEEAIKDALIDMLCLSRTKRIYGSFWSSFSDVAASLGKIELKIVSIIEDEKDSSYYL